MAYPFGPMPTLEQFVTQVAEKYDVERHPGVTLFGPRGETTIEYLTHNVDGRVFDVAVQENGGALSPHVICKLCKRLNIPVEDFGFSLGELPPPDESFSI